MEPDSAPLTHKQLLDELQALRRRVAELEAALEAAPQAAPSGRDENRQPAEGAGCISNWELNHIFNALPVLFFRMKDDGTLIDYHTGRPENLYLPPEQFLGRRIHEVLPLEVGTLLAEAIQRVVETGEPVTVEYTLPLPSGEGFFEARLLPTVENQVVMVVRNNTDQQQLVDRLRENEAMYRDLYSECLRVEQALHLSNYSIQNAGVPIFWLEPGGRFARVNAAACQAAGYPLEEIITMHVWELSPTLRPEDWPSAWAEIERKGSDSFETEYRRRDGQRIPVQMNLKYLRYEEQSYIFGFFTDLTEVRRALAEKETLLQELYHRTKNNMQVISSLLSLQATSLQDERLREILKTTQNRIHSMALVHQKLYQSQNLTRIEMGGYIQSLVGSLEASYDLPRRGVAIQVMAEEVYLGIDAAIPCGLILNELVSNALKHAFPGKREGTVVIHIRRVGPPAGEGTVTVEVNDDGVGLPEGYSIENSATLGLMIVQALTRQLHGHLTFRPGPGFGCRITFPDLPAA